MGKGRKTTVIAIIGGFLFIVAFGMYFLNKITTQEFTVTATTITMAITFFIGLFSKDYNQSHTFKTGDNPPKEDEEDEVPI